MKVLIYKTDIADQKQVKSAKKIFKKEASILDWSVDTGDIDKVLRIEASDTLDEVKLLSTIKSVGFFCEELQD